MNSQSKNASAFNTFKYRSLFHRLSLAWVLALGSSQFVSAQTYTYLPTTGATDQWSTGTGWSGIPASSIDTTLVFGPTAPTRYGNAILTNTNTNDLGTVLLNTLTLQGQGSATTLFPVNVTIAGGTLDFNTSSGSVAPVVNLTAAQGAGTSTVTYNVNSNLNLSAGTTFQGNGNSTFIFGGAISGAGNLTKTGTSSMTLAGANTYSGATAINGGIVRINSSANLGNGSATNTLSFSGGTLVSTANTYNLGANRAITLNGAGTIDVTSGTLTVDGTVTNGANLLTVQGAGNTIISGAIGGGAGGLTKTGAGVLTLSGSNAYTGLTTITTGTINLGNANALGGGGDIRFSGGTLQYSASNTTDYNTRITNSAGAVRLDVNGQNVVLTNSLAASNTGGLTLVGTGGGSLTLNGSNAYTGTTTITSGNLIIGNSSAISAGTLNINGGTLTAAGTARTFTNNVTLTNNSIIGAGQDVTFNTGTFTNSGGNRTLTVSNGTTNLGGLVYTSETSTNTRTLTFAGVGAVNVTGAIANSSAGVGTNAGIVAYTGSNTLTLSGANSFTGGFTLNNTAATLALNNDNALGGAGGAALGTLTWTGGTIQAVNAARTVGNAVNITGGTTGVSGTQDLTFTQTLNMASTSVITVNNSGVTSFNGGINLASTAPTGNRATTITGSGTVNMGNISEGLTGGTPSNTLTYAGTGTLNLNGSNTSTGNFGITGAGGKVVLGHSAALGFGGTQTLTLNAGQPLNNTGAGVGNTQVGNNTTLDLNGQTVNEPIVLQGGSLLNNSGTLATVNNGVAGIGLLVGGSSGTGLAAGSAITFTGGGGSGATAVVNTIGYATGSFSIGAGGSGYVVGNTFNIAGPGSTGAQIRVTSVDGLGAITGYIVGPGTTSVSGVATGVTAATVAGTGASFTINATPVYQISSLTMTNAGTGYTSAPTLSVDGGTFTTTAPILSQVQLTVANSNIGGSGDMNIAAGINSFGGANGFTKVGAGKLAVSGGNTYTGATVVTAGTLLVNGTHTGAGNYTVSGGTLGGTGTITGAVNAGITLASGAKLAPGASAGTLTAVLTGTGTVDISAAVGGANTEALVFELGAAGVNSDVFALTTGALNIGAGQLEFSDFSFSILSGFGAGTYTLFDTNAAILGSLGSSLTGSIGAYTGTLSLGGANDIILTVAPVPEPSTYGLLAVGAGFLLVLRRRMNKTA